MGKRQGMIATATLIAADAGSLVLLRGEPRHAVAAFAALSRSAGPAEIDRLMPTACSAGLFLIASWLAIGIFVSTAAAVPGAVGTAADRASRLLVPQVLRRVLAGATGLGVVLTPACAGALTPAGPAPVHHAGPGAITLVHDSPRSSGAIPAPTWPTAAAPTSATTPAPSSAAAPAATRAPTPNATPAPTSAPAAAPAPTVAPTPSTCTVAPGDSLWSIATRRLGPGAPAARIAGYWPRVYAQNRDVIGDDPSLIRPGQQFTLPGPTSEEPRS